MQPPLLSGQGPSIPKISNDEKPPPITSPKDYTLPKMTNQSQSLGGSFGGGSDVQGFNL